MSIKGSIPVRVSKSGVHAHTRGNEIPAILWLFLAISLVIFVRNGRPPTMNEGISLVIAGGVIVGIGAFAPELVVLGLVALLIAGVLAVPGIPDVLTWIQSRVSSLTGAA